MSKDIKISKEFVDNELSLDKGVTLSEDDLFVTDDLIKKIERREKLKEVIHDDSLTDMEKLKKLNLRSLSEVRRLRYQVK